MTQLAYTTFKDSNEPTRPMLARDADSMYWMSRYVERAEHVARVLWVNSNLLVDVGDLAPSLQDRQWESVMTIFHLADPVPGEGAMGPRVRQYMTFDRDNPSSIYTCLTRARENARGIREVVSAEVWENLNTLYWAIRSDDAVANLEDGSEEFFRSITTGSLLFQGLI